MCLALALTAAKLGAAVANYTEVIELTKTSDGIVAGAKVKDGMTGKCRLLTVDVVHFCLSVSVTLMVLCLARCSSVCMEMCVIDQQGRIKGASLGSDEHPSETKKFF